MAALGAPVLASLEFGFRVSSLWRLWSKGSFLDFAFVPGVSEFA